MTRALPLATVLAACLALGSCEKQLEAPLDRGVCWHMVSRGGKIVFNKVSAKEPQIETCAATLEAMRLRFLSLGGDAEDIDGAYQGQFLFLRKEGIFTSQTYTGARYALLVRTADGGLAKLGAGSDTP